MAYGRIIPRQMEKKSSENMLVHPSQNEKISICFPESSSCASPTLGTFSSDSDNTSVSGTSSKRLPGPINVKGQDASLSSGNLKNLYMFWSGAILKNSLSDNPKSCEKEFEETVQKRPEQSPKPEFSKLEEVFAETKSESEKQMSPESDLTGTSDLKCLSSPNMQNESIANLQITADQQNEVPKNVDLSSAEKSSYQGTCILDHLNEKEKTENYNEMEFLLEESCDTKKAKSNIGVKRKMELPFQSKGKNICTDASEEKYSNSKQHSNICMEGEKKSSVDMIEEKTLN
ncbi:hypothetical protein HNY73_010531 [Argiope bruennichi]|uniref:Uncharacterized protein n=2 Tax=Argiope bruennichi TaxID=94029 RepID=A0A8T0F1C2_ARGBR|nr:hypothetical protein HNY73_010531 [Argiope bruennichi]